MRTIITRGFIGRLGLCAMGLFVAANLHAAITDADLAKVTQFIQEGKTSRAKAEITILLDDNPNDPNATKLRKLLDSLGTPASPIPSGKIAADEPEKIGQSKGPSEAETLEWIKSRIDPDLRSLSLEQGTLTFFYERKMEPSDSEIFTSTRYRIDLRKILSLSVKTNQYGDKRLLVTTSGRAIQYDESEYVSGKSVRYQKFNDREIAAKLTNPWSANKKAIEDGSASSGAISEWGIFVAQDIAERFKIAFEHLVKLNGGLGKEPF